MGESKEVARFVGDIYRDEALAGDVFFIHGGLRLGGLRLGSKG
jgi:3-oxoacyl-[acyl-carrier protein] reductase